MQGIGKALALLNSECHSSQPPLSAVIITEIWASLIGKGQACLNFNTMAVIVSLRLLIPLTLALSNAFGLSSYAAEAPPPKPEQQKLLLQTDFKNAKTVEIGKGFVDKDIDSGLVARMAIKDRLVAWPQKSLVEAKSLPAKDVDFLRRLALDTWRGLDGLSDKEHGLPLDRVHFGDGSIKLEDAQIGDYTSITNIGFHFLAIVSAYELKFINRDEALRRLTASLSSLERMETYEGFYYNYYNTASLGKTSNFISFVDSGWLTAGLMVGRTAFPEIADRCSKLINQGNFRFFFDDQQKLMWHGFDVSAKARSPYHYGMVYTEARLASLIAIGKGDVPEEHWFAMARTPPKEDLGQSRQLQHRNEKTAKGFKWIGGYYEWRGFRFVPSWGGSLFEALMPALVLDEKHYAPNSLGKNDETHTAIQRRYALEDLKDPVWGMSPSSVPGSDAYAEYGVSVLGSYGYASGVVTPHAAVLAILTEPDQALLNLRQLSQRYALYGDFGFYDAVDPTTGRVAYKYLCIDQAMTLVALANHLADHAIQQHFAKDLIAQRVLPLIGLENFFD